MARELLTPVGLRSLSPNNPDYKPTYHGDLRTRDAAYHQGTVWAWLIGPFIDAWLKLHPNELEKARGFLRAFPAHLDAAGLGTISEVFDAETPHTAAGLHRPGLERRRSAALLGENRARRFARRRAEAGPSNLAASETGRTVPDEAQTMP